MDQDHEIRVCMITRCDRLFTRTVDYYVIPPRESSLRITPLRQKKSKSCGATCLEMLFDALGGKLREGEIVHALGGLRSFGLCTVRLAKLAQASGFDVRCYSLAKEDPIIRRRKPTYSLLAGYMSQGLAAMVTVDPSVLTNNSTSGRFHNILIVNLSARVSRYIDPADGKEHRVSTEVLLNSWTCIADRASAHTVVLRNVGCGITTKSSGRLRRR